MVAGERFSPALSDQGRITRTATGKPKAIPMNPMRHAWPMTVLFSMHYEISLTMSPADDATENVFAI